MALLTIHYDRELLLSARRRATWPAQPLDSGPVAPSRWGYRSTIFTTSPAHPREAWPATRLRIDRCPT